MLTVTVPSGAWGGTAWVCESAGSRALLKHEDRLCLRVFYHAGVQVQSVELTVADLEAIRRAREVLPLVRGLFD